MPPPAIPGVPGRFRLPEITVTHAVPARGPPTEGVGETGVGVAVGTAVGVGVGGVGTGVGTGVGVGVGTTATVAQTGFPEESTAARYCPLVQPR